MCDVKGLYSALQVSCLGEIDNRQLEMSLDNCPAKHCRLLKKRSAKGLQSLHGTLACTYCTCSSMDCILC